MGRSGLHRCLALAASLSLVSLHGAAAAPSAPRQVVPTVCKAWRIVPAPHLTDGQMRGVSGTSSTDVWSVGSFGESGVPPITLHWDGTTWSQVPASTAADGLFYKVAAISPTDVWAVGYAYGANGAIKSLIEHWDGSAWTLSPSPSPQTYDYLNSVTAISSSDVWAVGSYTATSGTVIHGLVEHWDGSVWNLVRVPDATPYATIFQGVDAISSTDIWAVGYEQTQSGITSPIQPMAEHWDGSSWTVVGITPPSGVSNELYDVSAVSTSDVWAVGVYGSALSGLQSLTEHWDGAIWTQVIAPQAPTFINTLSGVTAISSSDVWAAGQSSNGGPAAPLTLHWDGKVWALVPAASPYNSAFLDTWAESATDIWAVGASGSPAVPFTEQSKGPCP